MTAIQKLLKTAEAEVGYHDGDSYSSEELKCWPKLFVSQCFVQAFGEETAKMLLCDYLEPLISNSANYYKELGLYFDEPRIGDQVFFKESGVVSHTGIVSDMDADSIYTIEGKAASEPDFQSVGVFKITHLRTSNMIDGYGRPDWKRLPAGNISDYDRQMVISMKEFYYNTRMPKIAAVWTEEVIGV